MYCGCSFVSGRDWSDGRLATWFVIKDGHAAALVDLFVWQDGGDVMSCWSANERTCRSVGRAQEIMSN